MHRAHRHKGTETRCPGALEEQAWSNNSSKQRNSYGDSDSDAPAWSDQTSRYRIQASGGPGLWLKRRQRGRPAGSIGPLLPGSAGLLSANQRGLSARDQRASYLGTWAWTTSPAWWGSTAQRRTVKESVKELAYAPPLPLPSLPPPTSPSPSPRPRAQLAVTDVPRWGPLLGWHCE